MQNQQVKFVQIRFIRFDELLGEREREIESQRNLFDCHLSSGDWSVDLIDQLSNRSILTIL